MLKQLKNSIISKKIKLENQIRIIRSKNSISNIKDLHNGQRCFIVGNGPSLNISDLSKLKNEICFGTHRVYDIFSSTNWRPNYYCAQDAKLIHQDKDKLNSLNIRNKYIAILPSWKYDEIKGAQYIKLIAEEFYPDLPNFSSDITKGIYEGFTVTYMCIQIAIYMGFKEIYLLGVDHKYSRMMTADGLVVEDDSIKDHFSNKDKITNTPQLYKSSLAYSAAKKYAETVGIRIYNATRGGCLEIFERVDFDSLFLQI